MLFDIVHVEETDSTNRWLKACADTGCDMVVWTDYQTAGRGCGTNTWESERGKNLLFSILLHPKAVEAASQFRISMAISLAITRTIAKATTGGVSIKWPNDIYWHDRKLGGILIENSLTGRFIRQSIIGVGLNVNQTVFVSDAPNPVSLRQITGCEYDREQLLRELLESFTLDIVADDYRTCLYRRSGFHAYCDGNGEFEAEMVTVEDDGHLVLRDHSGRLRRYAFKEVQFILPQ